MYDSPEHGAGVYQELDGLDMVPDGGKQQLVKQSVQEVSKARPVHSKSVPLVRSATTEHTKKVIVHVQPETKSTAPSTWQINFDMDSDDANEPRIHDCPSVRSSITTGTIPSQHGSIEVAIETGALRVCRGAVPRKPTELTIRREPVISSKQEEEPVAVPQQPRGNKQRAVADPPPESGSPVIDLRPSRQAPNRRFAAAQHVGLKHEHLSRSTQKVHMETKRRNRCSDGDEPRRTDMEAEGMRSPPDGPRQQAMMISTRTGSLPRRPSVSDNLNRRKRVEGQHETLPPLRRTSAEDNREKENSPTRDEKVMDRRSLFDDDDDRDSYDQDDYDVIASNIQHASTSMTSGHIYGVRNTRASSHEIPHSKGSNIDSSSRYPGDTGETGMSVYDMDAYRWMSVASETNPHPNEVFMPTPRDLYFSAHASRPASYVLRGNKRFPQRPMNIPPLPVPYTASPPRDSTVDGDVWWADSSWRQVDLKLHEQYTEPDMTLSAGAVVRHSNQDHLTAATVEDSSSRKHDEVVLLRQQELHPAGVTSLLSPRGTMRSRDHTRRYDQQTITQQQSRQGRQPTSSAVSVQAYSQTSSFQQPHFQQVQPTTATLQQSATLSFQQPPTVITSVAPQQPALTSTFQQSSPSSYHQQPYQQPPPPSQVLVPQRQPAQRLQRQVSSAGRSKDEVHSPIREPQESILPPSRMKTSGVRGSQRQSIEIVDDIIHNSSEVASPDLSARPQPLEPLQHQALPRIEGGVSDETSDTRLTRIPKVNSNTETSFMHLGSSKSSISSIRKSRPGPPSIVPTVVADVRRSPRRRNDANDSRTDLFRTETKDSSIGEQSPARGYGGSASGESADDEKGEEDDKEEEEEEELVPVLAVKTETAVNRTTSGEHDSTLVRSIEPVDHPDDTNKADVVVRTDSLQRRGNTPPPSTLDHASSSAKRADESLIVDPTLFYNQPEEISPQSSFASLSGAEDGSSGLSCSDLENMTAGAGSTGFNPRTSNAENKAQRLSRKALPGARQKRPKRKSQRRREHQYLAIEK